jgi:histidinol-phosphate aminotransferase
VTGPQPVPHIARIQPYEWEASSAEVAALAGMPESQVVRFDTNTAPWPPVGWQATVADMATVPANEYPHPSNEPLRGQLAVSMGVPADQLIVTNGADEALYYIAAVYLGPGRKAILPTPTFSMFQVVTESVGADLVRVPTDEQFQLDVDGVLAAIDPDVRVIWLCSPNNPTGQLTARESVVRIAQAAPHAVVVLDEAYYEFSGITNASLLAELPNLIVVRTFSKGYGLAGARVGYLASSREITSMIDAVRLPQNLSALALAAALNAFADQTDLARRVTMMRTERDRLQHALFERRWEIVPPNANFMLVKPALPAAGLAEALQKRGLVVRSYGGNPRLKDYLRVTVRSPQENDRLLAALDQL